MIQRILRPWTEASTWKALCFVLLDLPVAAVTFTIVVTLAATAAGLLVTVLLAIPVVWLLFVTTRGLGIVERSRYRALLDVSLGDPHPPLPRVWWRRFLARITTASRWRELAYFLVLLPLALFTVTVAVLVWCGSLAFVAAPLYVGSLPGGTAKFGLFEVGPGVGAWLLTLVGVAGLLAAPHVTKALAALDTVVARPLLGLRRADALRRELALAEQGRVAAVDSAEAERRRIERDLHDGAQQRLVALAMDLGRAREGFDEDPERTKALVVKAHEESKAALAELRDLVRGIHPAVLADRGLDAALSSVIARSPVPVTLDVDVVPRPPAPVESTAYFVVSEALANVAKHARATRVRVALVREGDRLVVDVTDDGIGGAHVDDAGGLRGLQDRVGALGGRMHVLSPAGGPTTLLVELPCAS